MNIHPTGRHSITDARRKSAVLSRQSQQPPQRPFSLCLSLDRRELSAKIAESFQEFSVMLDKMSAPAAPPSTPLRSSTSSVRRASSVTIVPPVRQSTSSLSSFESSASTWSSSSRCASPTPLQTQAEESEEKGHDFSNPAEYDALYRLSSTGKLQELDELIRSGVDINSPNICQYGTTALMYAACFGHVECMRLLLQAGAHVDATDENGWTAIMWAVCNNNVAATRLLIEHSASSSIGSRNALEFVDKNNIEMQRLFPPRQQRASTLSHKPRQKQRPHKFKKSASVTVDEINRVYYQADIDGYAQCSQQHQTNDGSEASDDETDIDTESFESSVRSIYQFAWDKCLPDQMFVFSQDDMPRIIDTITSTDCIKSSLKSQDDLYISSNVLFLCCRFAHYHSNRELLHAFLNLALTKIAKFIKSNSRQLPVLCFWISNLHRLLLYLKRDAGLIGSTLDAQTRLSELIDDIYHLIVTDCTKRLEKSIEPAMLEFESCNSGYVEFAEDDGAWRRLFRRSSSNGNNVVTPYAITTFLVSTMQTLQTYSVHSGIIDQIINSVIDFVSRDLFLRILGNKKYLCRSKALQIRMNVSALEEWLRDNHQRAALKFLGPLAQLLQLLQCMSQQQTARAVQDAFPLLTTEAISRCIENYRYEVGEPRLISVAQLDVGRVSCEMPHSDKFSLPLTPPTPRSSLSSGRRSISDDIYNEVWKQKHEKKQEWKMMPSIPLEWLRKLDRK